ncbi:uncharacterized protein si:ch211-161h7.4 isoform X2 [Esox lucius]|uniref:uncharacterized protein si:ch211-161h7.4 isoform X2 n=1 Tax=Esox lucius TaxID=8010 RepID=UPI001476EC43|nr:uncharacterized protein si:ch211-161h7.4 isoform X2 [Esox lucius]
MNHESILTTTNIKRLPYLVNKDRPSSMLKWKAKLDMCDSSTWVNDLDAPSDLEEPPALLASSSFTPLEEGKKPSGKDMQPERRAQSSILDNEMELFFKEHCPSRALPIKTSSPIHSAQQDGDRTISPLLSEDEDQNPVQQPFSTLKRQAADCTNVESEEPSQRNLSLAVEPKEPISAKIVFQTSERMTIVQQPATKAAAFQPPETAKENQEGKVTSSFLQRLRKAGQSKPTGKVLMPFPVREAPAIELDDDFLILEDEAPSRFRFRRKPDPNKTTARPQPKQEDQSQGKENTKNQKKSDTAGEELVSMEEDQRKVEEEAADSHQEEALPDSQESEKRRRCKPGPWWLTSVVNTPDTETDNTHTSNNPTTKPTRLKPTKRRSRPRRLTIHEEPESPGSEKEAEEEVVVEMKGGLRVIPSPLRQLQLTAKKKTAVNQEGKLTSSFLQSKPTGPRKALVFPVKKAPTIELDDEFLFLEDEAPSRFCFHRKPDPNKTTARPQPKQEDQSQSSYQVSARTLANASQSEKAAVKQTTEGEGIDRPSTVEHNSNLKKGQNVNKCSSEPDGQASEKRKRCKPGPWWLTSVVNTPDTETDNTHTSNNPTTKPTRLKPTKRRSRPQRLTIQEEPERSRSEKEEEEVVVDAQGGLHIIPSPLRLLPQTASEKVFDFLPQHLSNNPKTCKVVRRQAKPRPTKAIPGRSQGRPQSNNATSRHRLIGQTRKMDISSPKTVKQTLATFSSSFSSFSATAPPVDTVRTTSQVVGRKLGLPSEEELASDPGSAEEPSQDPARDGSSGPLDLSTYAVDVDPAELPGGRLWKKTTGHGRNKLSDMSRAFESGPSSMIELEDYENEDVCLPSSLVKPHPFVPPGSVLPYPEVVAQLCPPPLRVITLQLRDRDHLSKWLSLLWPASRKHGGQIGPDHFQWFSYQDRALGCRVDLLAETYSCGTVLLGSYMKKPLLVDHYATTVFHLLTSGLTVTIDGVEVHYDPGHAFTIPCGRAYSLHNLTQEPAALHFTRMLTESAE